MSFLSSLFASPPPPPPPPPAPPAQMAFLSQPLIPDWFPPNRENWEFIVTVTQAIFPAIGSVQWLIGWYGMGKTSVSSRLNIPGRVAWMTMECPGFLTLLYTMRALPGLQGVPELPWQNRVLAGLFVIHYAYRAVLFPLLQPSMSPVHVVVWALAFFFQLCNAVSLGGWLAAYGPLSQDAWHVSSPLPQFVVGVAIFYVGLAGNFFHDEELREIRRREQRRQERIRREQGGAAAGEKAASVDKHYQIPQAGLFRYMLYPHYFCEWVEWMGFWMAAGWGCAPARIFFVNELFTMLPRAVRGRAWYVAKFGEEKIGKRWAVLPGIC